MLRQAILNIENWTPVSAKEGATKTYSYVVSEDCRPLAQRIEARVEHNPLAEVGNRWCARLLKQSVHEGDPLFVPDDCGDEVFTGGTFREVARDVLLALEGFLDDHLGAVQALMSLLDPPILTVSEVADELRTPRNTVLHWIKTGRLKAFRIGKKWQIRREDLMEAMEAADRVGLSESK